MSENPFYLARTKYNRNGYQGVDEAAKYSGVTKSLIEDLEDDEKQRGTSYKTVAILAKYYGVFVDYLCGNSKEPGTDIDVKTASKLLNLSESSVNSLKMLGKQYSIRDTDSLFADHLALDDILKYLSKTRIAAHHLSELLAKGADYESIDNALDQLQLSRSYLNYAFSEMIDNALGFSSIVRAAKQRREKEAYHGI